MSWWGRLWRRRKMEQQLEKELRFHIEEHAADLIARGVDPAEARRQARLAMGGPEQVKELCRDARGTRWLEDLLQDARYALRIFRNNPGFTAVALLTLALGAGATTVMFAVINGVLLKPLPYPQPARLVAVFGHSATWNAAVFGEQKLAYLDFLDCQRQSRSLDMAGSVFDGGTVSEPGEPEYVDLREISPDLFSVLRVKLALGRSFLPAEDRIGATPVMIVGYGFWQRHFAGKPEAIGASVTLDQKRYTVVGIAPAGFRLYGEEADVYTPLGQDEVGYLRNRQAHPVGVIARLRPGATLPQAQAELELIAQHLAAEYSDTNAGRTFRVQPLHPDVGDAGATLWLLLGAVSLVLLIACANVASLLLARAVSRERELAMRAALGASRGRLARQCITESAELGLAGSALGILLAAAGIRPFVAFWPGSLPRAEQVHLDWRVLLFALSVGLVGGFLFGLAPALRVPSRELERTLRSGARTVTGGSRRLHAAFVISELALAVVLLASAGILGRTLLRLASVNPGVDVRNVLTARVALSPDVLANPARIPAAWQDLLERARRVPGVHSVATVDTVPMRTGDNPLGYWTTPAVPPENKRPMALSSSASPDYLKVMRIPLLAGRFFNEEDRLGSQPAIVIDEVMARQAFGNQPALGKRLWLPDMPCVRPAPQPPPGSGAAGAAGAGETSVPCSNPFTVVGVVGHVRYWGLAGDDQAQLRAQFYYPFAQVPARFLPRWSQLMSIAIRTDVPPLGLVEGLRHELRGATGDQVLYAVHTLEQLASDSLAEQRFLLLLLGIFAALALLLACVGIYGVLAYLNGQRMPEFGLRMALGATAGDVLRLVLRQSVKMVLIAVAIGLFAAMAAGRLLERLVAGVQSLEPLTLAMMIAVLLVAALLASFLPARRASRIDPMQALRQE
ncbi:MAG TPA: ABC transporter permease [Candidatus Acidoferrales bacterium]|nr:ABC transporter permease [Candidatus Acidoferrales bacterium]